MRSRLSLLTSLCGFLTLTVVLSVGQAFAQNVKTLRVQPKTGDYAGQTFYTNSFAVIVGVARYAHLPKNKWLDYADKDAGDLRDLLVRSYGFPAENITVLTNEQATKSGIETALASLADIRRMRHDDRILVFFSGHGQTVKLANGGDIGFLIPYDADVDLNQLDNPQPYLNTCIKMQQVWDYLGASPAKHSLLLVDACFGGLLASGKALGAAPNPTVIAKLLQRPAQQVMTAGTADEEAKELPEKGHGAFTYQLLEELRAQAAVPDNVFLTSGLYAAIQVPVGNLTAGSQTPQLFNYGGTQGDFVFVSTAPQPVPPLSAGPKVPPTSLTPQNPEKPVVPGNSTKTQIGQGTKINPKDGAEMIFIPAGEFLMGDDDPVIKNDNNVQNNPRHTVRLSGYYIYKNLVTVAQYIKFCQEMHRQMPPAPDFNPHWSKKDHPIVNVSWFDAVTYCQWAGVQLPSEAQWEKAARGTDGRKFPWGNDFDVSKVWASKNKIADAGGTTAVGRYGISPYGVTDMAGNVYQWCADWYDDGFWSRRVEQIDPINESEGEKKKRVLRSGSWGNIAPGDFRCAYRMGVTPDGRDISGGFRCAAPGP